jgi:hypothetical protein
MGAWGHRLKPGSLPSERRKLHHSVLDIRAQDPRDVSAITRVAASSFRDSAVDQGADSLAD